MAPTSPAANLHSQLMRVWVSDPSSLSNRPDILARKMRFLIVRFRNLRGAKMTSFITAPILRFGFGAPGTLNPVGRSSSGKSGNVDMP